jgi:hypothetical protein
LGSRGTDGSLQVPKQKFDVAVSALEPDTFAPFSTTDWNGYGWADLCIRWPAANHFEEALPPHAVFPNTPALIVVGALLVGIPPEMQRG